MYISMQVCSQQYISMLSAILKLFSAVGNGQQKTRAKMVPKESLKILSLEHLTSEQISENWQHIVSTIRQPIVM